MNSYFLFPSSALSPPGLFSPGSGEKDTMCVCACILSRFSCVRLFVTPWTIAHQAPLSMGILQARILSGLPCPPPGDLPHPGIEPTSLMSPAWADGFFTTSATWEPQKVPQNTPIHPLGALWFVPLQEDPPGSGDCGLIQKGKGSSCLSWWGAHCLAHPPQTLSPTTVQSGDPSLLRLQGCDISSGPKA